MKSPLSHLMPMPEAAPPAIRDYFGDAQTIAPETVRARIIGRTRVGIRNLYHWRQVDPRADGLHEDNPNDIEGDASYYPAYEMSNNGSVPIDGTLIVELRPQLGGPAWVFDFVPAYSFVACCESGSHLEATLEADATGTVRNPLVVDPPIESSGGIVVGGEAAIVFGTAENPPEENNPGTVSFITTDHRTECIGPVPVQFVQETKTTYDSAKNKFTQTRSEWEVDAIINCCSCDEEGAKFYGLGTAKLTPTLIAYGTGTIIYPAEGIGYSKLVLTLTSTGSGHVVNPVHGVGDGRLAAGLRGNGTGDGNSVITGYGYAIWDLPLSVEAEGDTTSRIDGEGDPTLQAILRGDGNGQVVNPIAGVGIPLLQAIIRSDGSGNIVNPVTGIGDGRLQAGLQGNGIGDNVGTIEGEGAVTLPAGIRSDGAASVVNPRAGSGTPTIAAGLTGDAAGNVVNPVTGSGSSSTLQATITSTGIGTTGGRGVGDGVLLPQFIAAGTGAVVNPRFGIGDGRLIPTLTSTGTAHVVNPIVGVGIPLLQPILRGDGKGIPGLLGKGNAKLDTAITSDGEGQVVNPRFATGDAILQAITRADGEGEVDNPAPGSACPAATQVLMYGQSGATEDATTKGTFEGIDGEWFRLTSIATGPALGPISIYASAGMYAFVGDDCDNEAEWVTSQDETLEEDSVFFVFIPTGNHVIWSPA